MKNIYLMLTILALGTTELSAMWPATTGRARTQLPQATFILAERPETTWQWDSAFTDLAGRYLADEPIPKNLIAALFGWRAKELKADAIVDAPIMDWNLVRQFVTQNLATISRRTKDVIEKGHVSILRSPKYSYDNALLGLMLIQKLILLGIMPQQLYPQTEQLREGLLRQREENYGKLDPNEIELQ